MSDAKDLVEHVRKALHNVIDPEIGFNIVDIGLIYDIAVEQDGVATINHDDDDKGLSGHKLSQGRRRRGGASRGWRALGRRQA